MFADMYRTRISIFCLMITIASVLQYDWDAGNYLPILQVEGVNHPKTLLTPPTPSPTGGVNSSYTYRDRSILFSAIGGFGLTYITIHSRVY